MGGTLALLICAMYRMVRSALAFHTMLFRSRVCTASCR